ncbi:MAG TPA: biotin-dependent carboxyltransferase family protein [Vicinamibacterales bacterium]|nr:biotin-dependent carboxyltransferase family protein [Vicinamibacterales bacterium]
MAALSIVRPGMFTTVQDLGRWGFQSRGVPVCGAMDHYSHRLANRLVGNSDQAATLELTLTGPQIRFENQTSFAVTGAVFALTLDASVVDMNRMIEAPAGSILRFGERQLGARSYIAIQGGVDVPMVLGSRSTHVLTRMGGLDGRALRAGDTIHTLTGVRGEGREVMTSPPSPLPPLPSSLTPTRIPDGGARLRVIPGDQRLFHQLASRRFSISSHSDRMGYRLEGSNVGDVPAAELISSAVVTGAIQVTPAGQAILLMADHATTGGYPIGAAVIAADVPRAGQLAPGDWIEFEACSLERADVALREQEAVFGGR